MCGVGDNAQRANIQRLSRLLRYVEEVLCGLEIAHDGQKWCTSGRVCGCACWEVAWGEVVGMVHRYL